MPTATETIHALRTAVAHIERTLSRAIEPYGITSAQFELLQAIARVDGKSGGCSELAKQMAAPGPDVTRMLDRLDAAGLVTRFRDGKDRRIVHAMLTDKARELLQLATPVVSGAEATLFEGVAPDEVQRLNHLLQRLKSKCPGN